MKRNSKILVLAFAVTLVCNQKVNAQGGVSISETPSTPPYTNAILDVQSSTKGALLPSLTTGERATLKTTIGTDAEADGMIVYDNQEKVFYYWNASSQDWVQVANTSMGDDDWVINGNDIYRNTAGGKVGIGTSIPNALFEVQGNVGSNDEDHTVRLLNDVGYGIYAGGQSTGNNYGSIQAVNENGASGLESAPLLLQSVLGGGVGIGTTTPGLAKTYVENNGTNVGVYIGNGTPFGQAKLEIDGPAASHIWVAELGTRIFSVTGGGAGYFAGTVGIKTTTPGLDFEVAGGGDAILNSAIGDNPNLVFQGSGTEEGRVWTDDNGINMRTGASGTDVTVDASGNMGIGVTTPLQKLDVNGDVYIRGGADALQFSDWATMAFTDGNGRFSIYENAGTAGDLYLKDEAANRITMSTGGITMYTAPAGTTGTTVPWNIGLTVAEGSMEVYRETNLHSNKITNLATPTSDNDAATKAYVDAAVSDADAGEDFQRTQCYTTSTTWSTVINYSGAGEVKFVQMLQTNVGTYGQRPTMVRITADGGASFNFTYSDWLPTSVSETGGYTYNYYQLPANIRYKSSLLIEIARQNSAVPGTTSYVAWTKDQ